MLVRHPVANTGITLAGLAQRNKTDKKTPESKMLIDLLAL